MILKSMKETNDIDFADVTNKYITGLQLLAQLADTTIMMCDVGRGSGKTTNILAKRLVRIAYALPRSIVLLGGPTYVLILDTILPGILTFLAENYTRGIHYEYGKRPPKFFAQPYTPINRWEHTISFPSGCVVQFVSIDYPESVIGKNAQAFVGDEALKFKESDFVERVRPAIRGNREIFGKSPYFQSVCFTSSTPNYETDHDWWLGYKDEMKPEIIEAIQLTALRVMQARYKEMFSKSELVKDRFGKFAAKYEKFLAEKRKNQVYFLEGTSLSNLMVLGLDYINNQFKGSPSTIEKAKLSLLGIRPNKNKNPFFPRFGKHNVFEDSYRYDRLELYNIDGSYKKTCRDLKYYDHNAPLQMGYDPGNFMSIVVGQKKAGGKELRMLKQFWEIPPGEHYELAKQFTDFFGEYSSNKTIFLYYDRAANQRKDKYKGNPKGETDAFIFRTELQSFGWRVELQNLGQRTIYHWEHYFLFAKLMSEKQADTPRLRICNNECDVLIDSMNSCQRLKTPDNMIELDKTAERKLDYIDQPRYSPQVATSFMYLIWGLYHQYAPDATPATVDFEGL